MIQKVMTQDEAVTASKKKFSPIFHTFGRYVTNLRGTFVENVKKVQNQPTQQCAEGWGSTGCCHPIAAASVMAYKL
jgi:hypothetical protein